MSTASKNPNVVRPWCRPHRASIVLALVVAAMVITMNGSGFVGVDAQSGLQWQHGWPFVFSKRYLRDLPALENLYLSSTPVGDRGLRHLASCRQLRVLDLAGTRITHRGLRALAALGHLEELKVRDTCVGDVGVARLCAVLPGCEVRSRSH